MKKQAAPEAARPASSFEELVRQAVIASGGPPQEAEAAVQTSIWYSRGTAVRLTPVVYPLTPAVGPDLVLSVQLPAIEPSAALLGDIVRINGVLMTTLGCCVVMLEDGSPHVVGTCARAALQNGALRHVAEQVVVAVACVLKELPAIGAMADSAVSAAA